MSVKHGVLVVLTLWLAVAIPAVAAAQESGRIEGRVTLENGASLPGVTVLVDETDQTAVTDSNGRYTLTGVTPGIYSLTFSFVDLSAQQADVQVEAGGATRVDKVVDWDLSFAETITVTSASRRPERITEAPAAVTVISAEEIELTAPTGQVPKLLEFSTGVDYTQSGLYDINFNTRGFNSSLNRRILTLVDGRDPAVPFLGSQEWAAVSFPMDELSSVELVRGPGAALYGANAFNGVLNMTTKPPRGTEGGKVRVTAGELETRRADLRWATELGAGWYFKAVGGYQESDDFTVSRRPAAEYAPCATGTTTECLRPEAVPLALDSDEIAFGGLRFDKHFGNSVLTLEGGTAALEGPTFVTGIGRVQVTDVERPWTRVNFNTLHWNVLGYYDQRKAEDQVALASGARLFEDSSNLHVEVQGNTELFAGRGFAVLGAAYNEQEVDTSNRLGIHTLMAEAKSEDQQAVFGQLEYNFAENLKGVVAARVDESSLHDSQFSPKGSLVWGVTPNHSLRLTYNEAFQVPNYSEFFLSAPAGTPIVAFTPLDNAVRQATGRSIGLNFIPILARGNDDLAVEEITSYEIGYTGILSSRLFVTVDYYQNEVENFVTDLLPGVNPSFPGYTTPAFLPPQLAAVVLGTLRGGLGSNFAGLTTLPNGQPALVLSYANAGAVDTEGLDVALDWSLPGGWGFEFSYSWFDFEIKERSLGEDQLLPNAPENKFNAGLTYRSDRFDAGLRYRWVDDFDWAAGIFVGPVPSYDVVDLSAGYQITDNIEVGLDVSNLLDDEHWQSFGGDLISRRALGHVSLTW